MSERGEAARELADVLESRHETWRRIEQEARFEALDILDAEETVPLVAGALIAWVNTAYGRTDELSPVHRVGPPLGDRPYTACHEAIPDAIRRMVLSPALQRSMDPCRFCEAEYARAVRVIHAA